MAVEREVLLLHGKPPEKRYLNPEFPDPSNNNWIPWVQRRVNLSGTHFARALDVPMPYDPDYRLWAKELERFEPTERTYLVGASCGAGVILRWLSERPMLRVGRVVLVAPWLDPDKNYGELFDFVPDREVAKRCLGGLSVFYSSSDGREARESLGIIRDSVEDVVYTNFPNHGHFMIGNNMPGPEFPELVEEILRK